MSTVRMTKGRISRPRAVSSPSIGLTGSAPSLDGLRQATMFKVNVYVAALYVAKPSSDPTAILGSGAPSELILQFVRDVGADDLRKAWDEGFARMPRSGCLP